MDCDLDVAVLSSSDDFFVASAVAETPAVKPTSCCKKQHEVKVSGITFSSCEV